MLRLHFVYFEKGGETVSEDPNAMKESIIQPLPSFRQLNDPTSHIKREVCQPVLLESTKNEIKNYHSTKTV